MRHMAYASLVAVAVLFSATTAAKADQYAAIAYSESTGNIGYSYNCPSLAQAKRIALANCDAADADVVTWARNAHCAIALGKKAGAYGHAWGRTRAEAERLALEYCSQFTKGCYIARWVYSGK